MTLLSKNASGPVIGTYIKAERSDLCLHRYETTDMKTFTLIYQFGVISDR